jgi:GTP-binding protein Era
MKSGYVAIVGKPNTGKSTLLNMLLGQKLSITTSKPQTTRKNILGILSEENYQIIFLDTPGILNPGYLLQEKMMENVERSIHDADIILLLTDIKLALDVKKLSDEENIFRIINKSKAKKILLINKIDLADENIVIGITKNYSGLGVFDSIIPISAIKNRNIDKVLSLLVEHLPEHPKYFPNEELSTADERFFVSEIIREKILELYQEEIPYSCEVVIEDFKERENRKDVINAMIYVEKDSQKGILIGKAGAAIKKLGEQSRKSIEEFLQREVYLELRVKVKEKWRSDEKQLACFGYSKTDE